MLGARRPLGSAAARPRAVKSNLAALLSRGAPTTGARPGETARVGDGDGAKRGGERGGGGYSGGYSSSYMPTIVVVGRRPCGDAAFFCMSAAPLAGARRRVGGERVEAALDGAVVVRRNGRAEVAPEREAVVDRPLVESNSTLFCA